MTKKMSAKPNEKKQTCTSLYERVYKNDDSNLCMLQADVSVTIMKLFLKKISLHSNTLLISNELKHSACMKILDKPVDIL